MGTPATTYVYLWVAYVLRVCVYFSVGVAVAELAHIYMHQICTMCIYIFFKKSALQKRNM